MIQLQAMVHMSCMLWNSVHLQTGQIGLHYNVQLLHMLYTV